MNLKEQIEKEIGPAPSAPPDLRLLGWSLNPDAQSQYNTDISNYRKASAVILDRILNPMTVGQAENILGPERTKGLATDENYRPGAPQTIPSMVPSFQAPPIQPGPPMGMGLNPPTTAYGPGAPMAIAPPPNITYPPNQYPAMNALLTPDYNRRTSDYYAEGPRPTASTEGPTYGPPPGAIAPPSVRPMLGGPPSFDPTSIRPMTPGAPLQFQEKPGAPQTINPLELNRESPVNPPTRELMESYTKRYASPYFDYQRRGGAGSELYEKKKADFAIALHAKYPDMSPDEVRTLAASYASGLENQESLIDDRTTRQEQGDTRLGLMKDRVNIARDQLTEKKREFDQKMAQLKDLEKRGADPGTIRLKQLEELKRYHKHIYSYVMLKNFKGEMDDLAAQKMIEEFAPEDLGLKYQPQKGLVEEAFPGLFSPKLGPQVNPANPGGPISITPNPTPPPSQLTPTNQGVSSEDEAELRQATAEALKNPKAYVGKQFVTKSGKTYTFNGKAFQ